MLDLKDMHIAVLMGGPGSEREVSMASGQGVSKALESTGAHVHKVVVDGRNLNLPEKTDIVFNVIHGTFGEDGELQTLLEQRGIAYTGEDAARSRLAFDKILTKKAFAGAGVPSADFEVVSAGMLPEMSPPLVVKAPREGSSIGVYICKEASEIEPAIRKASELDSEILVEDFVEGRELTVGVLGDLALPIIEICPQDGFYDFRNKYPFLGSGGGADHVCPALLDDAEAELVCATALQAKDALGLQVYCRVDILLREDGTQSVLEINTLPGMTEASLLPEAAAAAGIGFPELCARIIELSRDSRKEGKT